MIGLQIQERTHCVTSSVVEKFRTLPVANISDCMSRMSAGGANLRPFHGAGANLAGPALTVKCRPGDNLMIHKALMMAKPGDVIVVDGGGDVTNALIGELMVATAIKRGISVLSIEGMRVQSIGKVTLASGAGPAHVAFTPDGSRALVTRGDNRISMLDIKGSSVTLNARELSAGIRPYGLDISPSGQWGVVTVELHPIVSH